SHEREQGNHREESRRHGAHGVGPGDGGLIQLPVRVRRLAMLLGQAAIVAGAIFTLAPAAPAAAQGRLRLEPEAAPALQAAPDLDVRASRAPSVRGLAPVLAAPEGLPGATMQWNEVGGLPASLIRYGGYLTEPSGASPEEVARTFLADHAALFKLGPADLASLAVSAVATTPANGVTQLVMSQSGADGREVFGSSLLFSIDAQ